VEGLGVGDALLCESLGLVAYGDPFEIARVDVGMVEVLLLVVDGEDLGQGRPRVLPSASHMQLEPNAIRGVVRLAWRRLELE